ncbi:MAG: S-layer homology domain-containing protein, partial [Pseudoflavonifractor sp.]
KSAKVTVAPKDISGTAVISNVNSTYKHTGADIEPIPTVMDGGTLLNISTDYTLTYSANKDVRLSAQVIVHFTGNYTGSKETTFQISANALTVTADGYTGVYNGQPHGISVTAAEEGVTVKYSATAGDYAVTPLPKTDAGTYTVYYEVSKDGSTTVTGAQIVTITPAPLTITARDCSIYVNDGLPAYGYDVSGLIGADVLTTQPTVTCPTADAFKTGAYPVTAAGAVTAVPGNYAITYVEGVLQVLNVHISDKPQLSFTVGGTVVLGSGGTVSIVPAEGYRIKSVTVNGVPKGAVSTLTGLSAGSNVHVTFEKIPKATPVNLQFTDVPENFWAKDAIAYVVERGLLAASSDTVFGSDLSATRQSLWSVLGRLDGTDRAGAGATEDAVKAWAVSSGISDGSHPGGTLTREQLFTTIWRYIGSPKPSGDLSAYSDAENVALYAREAAAWITESGIIVGYGGRLMPTDDSTRGQLAVILMRYCEAYQK